MSSNSVSINCFSHPIKWAEKKWHDSTHIQEKQPKKKFIPQKHYIFSDVLSDDKSLTKYYCNKITYKDKAILNFALKAFSLIPFIFTILSDYTAIYAYKIIVLNKKIDIENEKKAKEIENAPDVFIEKYSPEKAKQAKKTLTFRIGATLISSIAAGTLIYFVGPLALKKLSLGKKTPTPSPTATATPTASPSATATASATALPTPTPNDQCFDTFFNENSVDSIRTTGELTTVPPIQFPVATTYHLSTQPTCNVQPTCNANRTYTATSTTTTSTPTAVKPSSTSFLRNAIPYISIPVAGAASYLSTITLNNPYFPLITAIAGQILGTSSNFSLKDRDLCKTSFDTPLLSKINKFKQGEIKNLAYLAPFIPLLTIPIYHYPKEVYRNYNGIIHLFRNNLYQSARTVTQRIGLKNPLSIGLNTTAAIGITFTKNVLFKNLRKIFDPSGHLIVNGLLGYSMAKCLKITSEQEPNPKDKVQRLALTAATIYGISNAVLLYNTGVRCHTGWESITAGAIVGTIIVINDIVLPRISPSLFRYFRR
jgi:hypothetical protein